MISNLLIVDKNKILKIGPFLRLEKAQIYEVSLVFKIMNRIVWHIF